MSKILVVEDEGALRMLYKRDLEQDGHSVVLACDASEGLKALETEAPDLVVLDIRMPGVDGLDAMGRIFDKHPGVPVVLNTAFSSYKENFLSWAADAYVIKSSDTGELRRKVRELLAARQDRSH
jgi:DNA-binding response OmpR family regulator